MSMPIWVALLPFLYLTVPANAAIYRCDGEPPRFQDAPCGSTGVAGSSVGQGDGLRRSERVWLRSREAGHTTDQSHPPRRQSRLRQAAQQDQRCWRKRQQLDRVRAKLRRGYKPAQGERLRRSRRQYEDYLFRYCD